MSRVFHLIILAFLPLLALDVIRLLAQAAYVAVVADLLLGVAGVALAVARGVPYQWRIFSTLGISLIFSTYLLMSGGLVSAGRVYIVADVLIAALILSRRSTLLVWLSGAAALLLSGIAFASRSSAEVAAVAQRLTDPSTLLLSALITLTLSGMAALSIISLVGILGQSLRATEQALVDRDRANTTLEQRVAAHTGEFELAVDELRAREVRLRSILQTALDGFWAIDMQMRFTDVNEAYCAMSGYSRAEMLTMRIPDVEAAEQTAETDARIRRIMATGSDRFETRHRRKDGRIFDLEIAVTYISDGAGEMVCFCSDITARKQAERERAMQLRYAEALAHCSQLLLRQPESDAERWEILDAALTRLCETVGVSRLYVFMPPDDLQGEIALKILADTHAPGLPAYIEPSPVQILDAPHEMLVALGEGRWFGGPVPGQFPHNPHFQQSLDQNDVQAILMIPVLLGGKMWGTLTALDRVHAREWDAATIQLLRTAAEIIATFQQGWEANQALREREHFIQRVMEATPDVVHVVELATRRSLFINRPIAPAVGLAPELVQRVDEDALRLMLHPDDYGQVADHYGRLSAAADGEVSEVEYRVRLGDGRERWLLSRAQAFARDDAGRVTQILSIVQDITEDKHTSHALVSSEAQLRALRDALPDMLFIVRADGTILEFYASRQDDMLASPESFLGQRLDQVLPPEVARMAYAAITRVQASGDMQLLEYMLSLGVGERAFEARIVPIAGDTLLFVVRDITERRQSTEALLRAKNAAEAADKAKSTFLAHVSHEIRTPLTAIIGMASLLQSTHLSAQQREYLATIRTGAETLLTIIGNILDFSKIEAGQIELDLQPFDLRACLHDAVDLVALDAGRKGLALEYVVDAAVPVSLVGDRGRLRQVLVNLLGNAVKFTERGSVRLAAGGRALADAEYELALSIRDTGIGIAPEYLSQIFEPFVQADSTTTRRFGGTGLGLTISRQIIERMGGEIRVTSGPSAGSTFMIRLPLHIAALPMPAHVGAADAGLRPMRSQLRVLLAEDNPINREVLSRLLESLGIVPDLAQHGLEALSAVARQTYDVVLMDIQMPELDGEQATQRIRALRHIAQPHIIALTASALRGDRERYLAAGMDDYLSKPVQVEDLCAALDRAGLRGGEPARSEPALAPAPSADAARPDDMIDWHMIDRLLASVGGGQDQVSAIVLDLFRSELSAQVEDIAGAIAADDRPRIRLLAHKLRGGSRQLGAALLADHWELIEAAAQISGEPLAELLAYARHLYAATLAQLTERLGHTPSA
ncbi:PAS domain S-box protein [Oscillochloris sp. ZM17-4]|nr:PAS domain S-box protein [Oscillochloris sp. ZM17-4]MBX0330577.1 PAS domain S-box protein [Oscillochloris sp. ZM17-4]